MISNQKELLVTDDEISNWLAIETWRMYCQMTGEQVMKYLIC
jgi:hypothetical protein